MSIVKDIIITCRRLTVGWGTVLAAYVFISVSSYLRSAVALLFLLFLSQEREIIGTLSYLGKMSE